MKISLLSLSFNLLSSLLASPRSNGYWYNTNLFAKNLQNPITIKNSKVIVERTETKLFASDIYPEDYIRNVKIQYSNNLNKIYFNIESGKPDKKKIYKYLSEIQHTDIADPVEILKAFHNADTQILQLLISWNDQIKDTASHYYAFHAKKENVDFLIKEGGDITFVATGIISGLRYEEFNYLNKIQDNPLLLSKKIPESTKCQFESIHQLKMQILCGLLHDRNLDKEFVSDFIVDYVFYAIGGYNARERFVVENFFKSGSFLEISRVLDFLNPSRDFAALLESKIHQELLYKGDSYLIAILETLFVDKYKSVLKITSKDSLISLIMCEIYEKAYSFETKDVSYEEKYQEDLYPKQSEKARGKFSGEDNFLFPSACEIPSTEIRDCSENEYPMNYGSGNPDLLGED